MKWTEGIRKKAGKLIGKSWMYNAKEIEIISYRFPGGDQVVFVIEGSDNIVIQSLDQFHEFEKSLLPIDKSVEVSKNESMAMAKPDSNSENPIAMMKGMLVDQMKKLNAEPTAEQLKSAQIMNNTVNTLMGVVKTEILIRKNSNHVK